jgi:hypothetical protein
MSAAYRPWLKAHGTISRLQRFCGPHDPEKDQSGLDNGLLLDSASARSCNLNVTPSI